MLIKDMAKSMKRTAGIASEHRSIVLGCVVTSAKILLVCEVVSHVMIEDLKSGALSQAGGLVYAGFMMIVVLDLFNKWAHGKY